MKVRYLFGILCLVILTACNSRYRSPGQPDFHPTTTYSYTHSPTPPITDTCTPSHTETLTAAETATPSFTDTPSFTPPLTDTDTPSPTDSFTEIATETTTPSLTNTPTSTQTKTLTLTPYFTPCQTLGAIIFASGRDGYAAIYTMDPDGSGQTPFMQVSGFNRPKWSPNRSGILNGNQIFDSGGNLLSTLSIGSLDTWSGNGTLLATKQFGWTAEFWSVEPDGSNPTYLSTVNTGYQSCGACPLQTGWAHAAWSPDRTKIAFAKPTTMWTEEIFGMNSDGSNLASLTGVDYSYKDYPAWSPDGSRIAYCHIWDNLTGELAVMNADGGGNHHVTTLNLQGLGYFRTPECPTWSPDGSQIAFGVLDYYPSPPAGYQYNILVINADGTGLTQLTFDSKSRYPDWR